LQERSDSNRWTNRVLLFVNSLYKKYLTRSAPSSTPYTNVEPFPWLSNQNNSMLVQSFGWTVTPTVTSVLALPPTVEPSVADSTHASTVAKSYPGFDVKWGQFFNYPYGFCRLSAGWETFSPRANRGACRV